MGSGDTSLCSKTHKVLVSVLPAHAGESCIPSTLKQEPPVQSIPSPSITVASQAHTPKTKLLALWKQSSTHPLLLPSPTFPTTVQFFQYLPFTVSVAFCFLFGFPSYLCRRLPALWVTLISMNRRHTCQRLSRALQTTMGKLGPANCSPNLQYGQEGEQGHPERGRLPTQLSLQTLLLLTINLLAVLIRKHRLQLHLRCLPGWWGGLREPLLSDLLKRCGVFIGIRHSNISTNIYIIEPKGKKQGVKD